MLSKIGIGFISIFLLKARVLYLTILKRKNLSLPFKGCNRVVSCDTEIPSQVFVRKGCH